MTATAHIVNNCSTDIQGARRAVDRAVGANSAALVADFDLGAAEGNERETYMIAELQLSSFEAVRNYLLLAEPKELSTIDPCLTISVEQDVAGKLAIIVSPWRFAPYVWLRRSGDAVLALDDNFFHLQPGELHRVVTRGPIKMTAEQFGKLIFGRGLTGVGDSRRS
jgi:hypothetical protein